MADSNKHYPLTIETVKKVKAQNREGIKPEVLETAEVITGKPKEVEPEYADIVGQISLKSLEKTTRKRRDKERSREQDNRPQQRGQQQQRGGQAQQGGQPNEQRGPQQQNRGQQRNPRGPQQRGRQQDGSQQDGSQQPPLGNRPQQNLSLIHI